MNIIIASWRQIAMALGSLCGCLVLALKPWPATNEDMFLQLLVACGTWFSGLATYSVLQNPVGAPKESGPVFSTGELQKIDRNIARKD